MSKQLYTPSACSSHEKRAGCAICESEQRSFERTAALLPLGLPPRKPHPRVREQLLARIRTDSKERPRVGLPAGLHVVRANQGTWERTGADDVSFKQLFYDQTQETMTMLVRIKPGTNYSRHRHAGIEHCLVLEGDLRIGDLVFQAGDYQANDAKSNHGVSSTEHGCLLLLVASTHDQLLA